jgi:serine/threonine protein kinase
MHGRPVALKVLHRELAATLGPERFQREIKLAARLQHPHILTVHDSGETAGKLWYTMPYVEGESLRDRLRGEKQLASLKIPYYHSPGWLKIAPTFARLGGNPRFERLVAGK